MSLVPGSCWHNVGPLLVPHDSSRFTRSKAFLDTSSVASQPVGNSHWTGAAPLVAHSMAVEPDVSECHGHKSSLLTYMLQQVVNPNSSTAPPEYQDELTWLLKPGQSSYHACFSSSGSGSGAGLVGPENGAYVSGAMT